MLFMPVKTKSRQNLSLLKFEVNVITGNPEQQKVLSQCEAVVENEIFSHKPQFHNGS